MGIIAEMHKSQGRRGRMTLVEHHDPETGVYYVREKIWSKPARPRVRKPARPRRQTQVRSSGRRARARHTSTSSRAAAGGGDSDGDGDSDPPPPRRVLRLQQVVEITGLKRPTIYKLIALKKFPAQVKLGSTAAGWISTEIDRWLDEQIAERDARGAK